MKRVALVVALGVAALAAVLLWPGSGPSSPAPPQPTRSAVGAGGGAPARPVARPASPEVASTPPPPEAREWTPERQEKQDRIAAQEERADQRRRELFAENLHRLDLAIERARAEGASPEYIAALEERAALVEDQADREAEEQAAARADEATEGAAP